MNLIYNKFIIAEITLFGKLSQQSNLCLGVRGLNFEAPLSPLKPPLPARPKTQTFLTLEPSGIPARQSLASAGRSVPAFKLKVSFLRMVEAIFYFLVHCPQFSTAEEVQVKVINFHPGVFA